MDTKTYVRITGALFAVLAVVHVVRLFYGWGISVNDTAIPLWVSWFGIALTGFFSYSSFMLQKK